MTPCALVLLHSPLTTAVSWGGLGRRLAANLATVVVEVTADTAAPYAGRYVAQAAAQVASSGLEVYEPVLLVAHSAAGPLLGQIGFALRAARRPVAGYLFVDAGLPRPGGGASRLDLTQAESADVAADLRRLLQTGGSFPTWSRADLAEQVPYPDDRVQLVASLRPRGLDFFDEPLPCPLDWPDAPAGVLQTSDGYQLTARLARGRGWPVVRRDLGHFAAVADPVGTEAALLQLIDLM